MSAQPSKPDDMEIIMSIQPQHVRKIFSREKRFEFRRRINREITRVVIYETAPTSAIVGWFTVIEVLSEPPETLWPLVQHEAGITREQYDAYFLGCSTAHAIQIGGVTRCEPIPLAQYGIQRPPQSWMYFHGVIDQPLAPDDCGMCPQCGAHLTIIDGLLLCTREECSWVFVEDETK